LDNLTSGEIPNKYKGMIVSITDDQNRTSTAKWTTGGSSDNNGLWILTEAPNLSTNPNSWTKVGSLPDPNGNPDKVLSVNSSGDGYELTTRQPTITSTTEL